MKRFKTKTFQFNTRGQDIIATAVVYRERVNVAYMYAGKPGQEVDGDELKDLNMSPVFKWADRIGIMMGGY